MNENWGHEREAALMDLAFDLITREEELMNSGVPLTKADDLELNWINKEFAKVLASI